MSDEVKASLEDLRAKAAKDELCMHEVNEGIITRIVGDDIRVQYDTPDGPREHTYHRSQFLDGNVPGQWDRIHTIVYAYTSPPVPTEMDDHLTPDQKEALEKKQAERHKGPLEI